MNSNKQRFENVQFLMHAKLILNAGFWQAYVNLVIVTSCDSEVKFHGWFLLVF